MISRFNIDSICILYVILAVQTGLDGLHLQLREIASGSSSVCYCR